ncbi:MAG: DUF5808 domain-containing protein [Chloroflexota bacterium]|nr:DUF5808 domain-containing protein [Chloroflexota bacterium]
MRKRLSLNNVLGVITGLLAIAAVVSELRKPSAERTWHGKVAGVPYDFRPLTQERLLRSFWRPDSDSLFTEHALGVGWGINLAYPLRLVRSARRAPQTS